MGIRRSISTSLSLIHFGINRRELEVKDDREKRIIHGTHPIILAISISGISSLQSTLFNSSNPISSTLNWPSIDSGEEGCRFRRHWPHPDNAIVYHLLCQLSMVLHVVDHMHLSQQRHRHLVRRFKSLSLGA